MKEKEEYSSYELRALGHCKETEQCVDDVYCNCPCKQCKKQDCFRPGCKCSRVHPYKTPGFVEEDEELDNLPIS